MGDWTMVVSGTGVHHNNSEAHGGVLGHEDDADQRLLEFTDGLLKQGHQVRHAAFLHGGGADVVETHYTNQGQRAGIYARADGRRDDVQAVIAAREVRRQPERPTASVRAKFRCTRSGSDGVHAAIELWPVYDPDPNSENGRFFAATPGGKIELYVVNPAAAEQFEVGKEYYVDFTLAS